MATPTPTPTVTRVKQPRCKACHDTGVVTEMVPKPVGRASDGTLVVNPHWLVPRNHACTCRQGWGTGGTA